MVFSAIITKISSLLQYFNSCTPSVDKFISSSRIGRFISSKTSICTVKFTNLFLSPFFSLKVLDTIDSIAKLPSNTFLSYFSASPNSHIYLLTSQVGLSFHLLL